MLKRLHLRNFTVFADAEFEFGEGLNVLVGTNGTGKTHVLKAGYVAARVTAKILNNNSLIEESYYWSYYVSNRLKDIFQPEQIGKLVSAFSKKKNAYVTAEFCKSTNCQQLDFRFPSNAKQPVKFGKQPVIIEQYPKRKMLDWAIFLTPKEPLSFSWLRSIHENRVLPIDDTYPALLDLASIGILRDFKPSSAVDNIIQTLERIIGGKVAEKNEKFYIVSRKQQVEMNLVAEGVRKFVTLERLLANGIAAPENVMFWDEPEANLNPALLKELAAVLTDLAQAGFQIILATHSLFLMRELHILAQQKKKPVRYFGLYTSEEGDVRVEQQDDLMQLRHLVALDAELAQTFDFEATLEQDYAGDN